MALQTRLTARLGIEHPILSAPMAFAAGGKLAAAVSQSGGLGLIGGGYGDPAWLSGEFAAAGNARVGCGFITWSLASQPALLEQSLSHAPAAIMLSFGDPRPFAPAIKRAGSLLLCQVQSLAHACTALEAGAEVIIAQGTEAGGHGGTRASFTLTPEIADFLARESPDTLLCTAGGVADGRGLAAALMLGADGVLVGSRLWASQEALVHPHHHRAAIAATGDDTIRQRAADIIRRKPWPREFTGRVLRNAFTDRWHGREQELEREADRLHDGYMAGAAAGDPDDVAVWIGEVAGFVQDIPPAADIIKGMAYQAEHLLRERSVELAG